MKISIKSVLDNTETTKTFTNVQLQAIEKKKIVYDAYGNGQPIEYLEIYLPKKIEINLDNEVSIDDKIYHKISMIEKIKDHRGNLLKSKVTLKGD